MEFSFDVNVLFPNLVTRTVGGRLPLKNGCKSDVLEMQFAAVVDAMGEASAKAQELRTPITTFQKFQSSKQILYTMKEDSDRGAVVGIIKVGRKRLFLNDPCGQHREVEPVCVLDFYVHESRQRCGYGKKLFGAMLEAEEVKPFEIAIDRPSTKFISFLKKHYSLQSFLPQGNNYVVFNEFFTTCIDVGRNNKKRLSLQDGNSSFGSPCPSQLNSQGDGPLRRNIFNHPGEVQQPHLQTNTLVKRFTKQLSSGPFPVGDNASSFNSPTHSGRVNANATPKINTHHHFTKHGGIGDSEFNWSPATIGRTHSMTQPCPDNRATIGVKQQEYNIITGIPTQKTSAPSHHTNQMEVPSHHNVVSKHIKWRGRDSETENDNKCITTTKAPFLNMRRSNKTAKNPSFATSTAAATQATNTGFYSAGMQSTTGSRAHHIPVQGISEGFGKTHRQQCSVGYSRHSGGGGVGGGGGGGGVGCGGGAVGNQLGILGTSITHQLSANTRKKLNVKDKRNSHVT